MKNFMELCLQRQSCRNFADTRVEHEKLVQCVEAGRLTPSACNSQPWSFVVVETPELVAAVAKCGQQMNMNAFLTKAAAFIVVLEEHAVLMEGVRRIMDSQYFAKGDLGAATVQVCLAAADQGLGTCIIGIYDRQGLCNALGIPPETRFAALIAVGYPAENSTRTKHRKPLSAVARFL